MRRYSQLDQSILRKNKHLIRYDFLYFKRKMSNYIVDMTDKHSKIDLVKAQQN